jgi:hypothetical protein
MDFNKVGRREGGWVQKVLFRPSADSFAVGRRQKVLSSLWLVHVSRSDRENKHMMLLAWPIIPLLMTEPSGKPFHCLVSKEQGKGREGI